MSEIDKINRAITRLHKLKENCRKHFSTSPVAKMAFFEIGRQHCNQCAEWSEQQKILRVRKKALKISAWIMSKKSHNE